MHPTKDNVLVQIVAIFGAIAIYSPCLLHAPSYHIFVGIPKLPSHRKVIFKSVKILKTNFHNPISYIPNGLSLDL